MAKAAGIPVTHTFADYSAAIYYAYVRQVGAGTVAAGGIITLIKTLPTIVKSVKGSMASLRGGSGDATINVARTDKDLSLKVVGLGSLALIAIISVIPNLPGDGFSAENTDWYSGGIIWCFVCNGFITYCWINWFFQ